MSISTDVYNLSLTLILSVAIVSAIAVYFTLLRGQLKNMTMRLDETIRLLKQLALTDIPGTNSEPFRDDPTNNLSPVPNPRTMTYGIPPATHASQGNESISDGSPVPSNESGNKGVRDEPIGPRDRARGRVT